MPGFSASIKERMLYSSCKNSVVEAIQKVASTYTCINWGEEFVTLAPLIASP